MTLINYDRQSRIPDWNQQKLSDATVAVVGAGALGNHVCLGLIGLGIGTIKIYDYDTIEAHNLNRQSLFCVRDIGKNKAEILAQRLEERNTGILAVGIDEKIEEETIEDVIRKVDLVVDCVDRIFVRRILSRFCLKRDIPLIHGGISWMGGQAGVFERTTPCINCIYPDALQREELDAVTSCIDKPEPSVVYISQIVAGLMVYLTRRVLLPIPSDPPLQMGLFKLDLRLDSPFYFERTRRKADCECVEILRTLAPKILNQEAKAKKQKDQEERDSLAEVLNLGAFLGT